MFGASLAIVLSVFCVYHGMSMLFKVCIYFRLGPGDADKLRPMTDTDRILFQWYKGYGHAALVGFLRRNAVVQTASFLLLGFLLLLWAFASLEKSRSPGWAADIGMWFLFVAVVTGLVAAVVVFGNWRKRTEPPNRQADRHVARRKEPVWFIVVLVMTAIAVAVFFLGAILSLIFG